MRLIEDKRILSPEVRVNVWPGFETSQILDTIYPTRRAVCEDRAVLVQR